MTRTRGDDRRSREEFQTVPIWEHPARPLKVAQQTELAADDHLGLIYFVPFIPHHLCGSSAQGWFIRTLRDSTVPANHFFASFDSNGPLRVVRIPGDFHSFYPHDIILQSLLCIIAPSTTTNCSKHFS